VVNPKTVVSCDAAGDNTCAKNTCDSKTGQCDYAAQNENAPCNADNSVCSVGDKCTAGVCLPGAAITCDDKNPCTDDSCDPQSGCKYVANTAPCTDGNACTVGDVCKTGACTAGAAKDCNDSNACTDDACNTSNGSCANTANSALCDDGNACTSGDKCGSGSCVGSAIGCDDGNLCTNDACDSKTGCTYGANTLPCSDGNACTTGDKCGSGSCTGNPVVPTAYCDDGNPCTTDACDSKTGCKNTNNTASCSDGNACTNGDTCSAGNCIGSGLTCDDGNACTTDSCNPGTGCVYQNNTLQCSDGNACTTGDQCTSGVCKGNAVASSFCDDGNPCTTDSCDKSAGCVHANNTANCDDGNPCTQSDTCAAGSCKAGTNTCACSQNSDCAGQEDGNACNGTLFCDKGTLPYQCKVNPATVVTCSSSGDTFCRKNTCNTANGTCSYVAQNSGAPCDADGSVCTSGDKCVGTSCQVGANVVCNDNNACTDDSCDPTLGCKYVANTVNCSDGNACTQGDKCASGACVSGTGKTCNDGNLCTADSCNTTTGDCVFNGGAMNGSSCDADASLCTAGDSCQSGNCVAGPKLACDDGQLCTSDSCDPVKGCQHTANNAPCNDGNACSGPDVCSGGVCAPPPLSCDDNNPCTIDSCNPQSGCAHLNVLDKTSCGPTSICFSGTCTAGKCGDTVLMTLLGEQCDDGNTASGDGCSAICKEEDTACADGTREGLMDKVRYPKVAQCNGPWVGSIGSTSGNNAPNKLCGVKFHVCNSSAGDQVLLKSITQPDAFQTGCWAINAANDLGTCQPCTNTPNTNDMAGLGKDCKGKITNYGNSCISANYRIDAADQTCVRSSLNTQTWILGVMCCAN
jgi:cysteine-rich repeat protein